MIGDIKRKIKRVGIVLLSLLVPVKKNRIYARCRLTHLQGKCDLMNHSSSNMLLFLDSYLKFQKEKRLEIILEYSDSDRRDAYVEYARSHYSDNIKIVFLKTWYVESDVFKRLLSRFFHFLKQLSCNIWLCETGDTYPNGKLPFRRIVCLNYFISCKNDLIVGQNFRWTHLHGLVTTSLLASQVVSSSIGVKLDRCVVTGFPRNDVLFRNEKKELIENWLYGVLGFHPKRVFLYAPTYRDYELSDAKTANLFLNWNHEIESGTIERKVHENRPLLGYEAEGFESFLKENHCAFIYHLHPMQKVDILNGSDCMIEYEDNYDFTLYDLMAYTDCVITDYSSIGYDFLLTDRPLIFNLYDLELYERKRGLSYDPYVDFCPGHIVTNWSEMKQAMQDVLCGRDPYAEQRQRVTRLLHKYRDDHSTERVIEYFDTLLR